MILAGRTDGTRSGKIDRPPKSLYGGRSTPLFPLGSYSSSTLSLIEVDHVVIGATSGGSLTAPYSVRCLNTTPSCSSSPVLGDQNDHVVFRHQLLVGVGRWTRRRMARTSLLAHRLLTAWNKHAARMPTPRFPVSRSRTPSWSNDRHLCTHPIPDRYGSTTTLPIRCRRRTVTTEANGWSVARRRARTWPVLSL